LPPRLAPIQVVAIPIYRQEEQRSAVMEVLDKLVAELREKGVRVHVDDRDESLKEHP
jgi:prolyl-tRNA synthetase